MNKNLPILPLLIILQFSALIQITISLCLQNCLTCSSNLYCLQCTTSTYIALSSKPSKGCLPCLPGCKTCTSQFSACTTCAVGYYMDSSRCLACQVNNCDTCDSSAPDICTGCSLGYFLIESSGTCETCSLYPNAITCRQNVILTCQPKYFVSNGQNCLLCAANCLKCTSATFCSVCNDGYFGSNCSTCHSSCQTCIKSTACLTCKAGYFFNGSLCTNCNFSSNVGCISCDTTGKCTRCMSSYYLNSLNICVNISVPMTRCARYQLTNSSLGIQCKQCQLGYYLSANSSLCMQCSLLCSNCTGMYSTSTCNICEPSFGVSLSSSACGYRINSITGINKNKYLSQWNFPINFSALGSTFTINNSNCPSWTLSTRSRVKLGVINGVKINFRVKLTYSISNSMNLSSALCTINFNNITIVQSPLQQLSSSISKCSQNLSSSTNQYTQIISLSLPTNFNVSYLTPINTQLADNSNYLQISSVSNGLFLGISQIIVSYQMCHPSCALCSSSLSCLLCQDPSFKLEDQRCVYKCDQFYYLYQNSCLKICPQGTYANQLLSAWSCTQCPPECTRCQSNFICSSCSSGFYLLDTNCIKQCPVQYFSNNISQRCQPCSSPCFTCVSSKICLSCSYNFFYNGTCVSLNDCPKGYYPSLATMKCQLCVSPCLQCYSETSCKSCLNSTGYLFKNKCVSSCPNGYLQNLTTQNCDQCDSACRTCKNQTTFCLSCMNAFLLDGNCISSCPEGLYENYTTMVCSLCKSPCLTCRTNYNVCKNCIKGYILHEQINSCILQTDCLALVGSFVITRVVNISSVIKINQKFCTKCPQQCILCNSSTQCQQCQKGYYLLGTVCLINCPFGYFNSQFTKKCQLCSSNCTSCLYESTFCVICPIYTKLTYNHICITGCANRNELSPSCQKCSSPCYTCADTVTKCQSCVEGFYYYNQTNQCLQRCYDGYFSQRVSRSCQKCDLTCLTCTNSSSQCTSCPATTYLYLYDSYYKSGVCIKACPSRYFLNILSISLQICQACQEPCLQCKQSSTTCLSCVKGVLNVNQCILQCPQDKYESNNKSCLACSPKCLSCFGSNDNQCYSCKIGFYYFEPEYKCSLGCPSGYIPSKITSKCQVCEFPCLQCINSTTTCTKCWNEFPSQNTSMTYRQYSFYFYSNQCLRQCPIGTFLSQRNCILCHSPCLSCLSGQICLTCQKDKYYLLNQCLSSCPSGYFEDNLLMRCIKCEYPCKTCISQTQCLECIDGVRVGYVCSMIDQCPSGQFLQYKQTNGLCAECSQQCSQCTDKKDKCTLCSNYSLILFNFKCISSCPIGYYKIESMTQNKNQIKTCTSCPPQCLQCTSDKNCTICALDYYYLNFRCISICPPAYFSAYIDQKVNASRQCFQCANQCKTCVNSHTNCLSCKEGFFWYQFRCLTDCPVGTYIDPYQSSSSILANYTSGTCRQCIFPCKQCENSRVCLHCLGGFYKYQGFCIQKCKKPLVILDDGEDVQCIQSCPAGKLFKLDYGNYLKCSNQCKFPYILSSSGQQCLFSCPQSLTSYINQNLQCKQLSSAIPKLNETQLTNANISMFVDKKYGLKLIASFNNPVDYKYFLQYQAQSSEDLFGVIINTDLLYKNGSDQSIQRRLLQIYSPNRHLQSFQNSFVLEHKIIEMAQKYILIDINPASFNLKALWNKITYITLELKDNTNLLIRNSMNSIPLQVSAFKCTMPAYEPYPSSFSVSAQFAVFGQVLSVFLLIVFFVLFLFNWFAKGYQIMHFCQLLFLLALLEIQYPPNLWLFFQGFQNMHWFFIKNWFINQNDLNRNNSAPSKIASIFVDSNFIRICGHVLCFIIIFVSISFLLYISKFLTTTKYPILQKVTKAMHNKFKLIKWSHIHDLAMIFAMIIVFGFFAQMNDYSNNSVMQILGILCSYVFVGLLSVYYVLMGYKLHVIVKLSEEDPNRFCDKKYLFRDNMLSITESAIHPKQLYLNYLRAIRIVIFGGIVGGFSQSPMLCLASIITILVISTLIYLICKPYPDNLQNLLLGLADLCTSLAFFIMCFIHFRTIDHNWQSEYEPYLQFKWRLGWISIVMFIITAFLLLAELLVSIVKGNSGPLKLSAEDGKNIDAFIIGAPKIIEVSRKNQFQGWQAQQKGNSIGFGFKYQAKQV